MNFGDRPLTAIESFAIIVAIVLLSLVLIWRARRHQIQTHFSLEAEPGGGYAAVFDQKSQSSKIIKLKKKGGY